VTVSESQKIMGHRLTYSVSRRVYRAAKVCCGPILECSVSVQAPFEIEVHLYEMAKVCRGSILECCLSVQALFMLK
jgi:hypothetical protein